MESNKKLYGCEKPQLRKHSSVKILASSNNFVLCSLHSLWLTVLAMRIPNYIETVSCLGILGKSKYID